MYLNRENQFAINTTPKGSQPTYAQLAKGMYNWSESLSQTIDETDYYDGTTESDIIMNRRTFTFQCHSNRADEAAAYVWGLRDEVGEACQTTFKWTEPDNTEHIWNVTIANVVASGGDATGKDGFSFEVRRRSVVS